MRVRIVQILLLLIGVAGVTFGVGRGEAIEVMRKAIIVCLECVGIG